MPNFAACIYPEMDPPNLPQLLLDELAQEQHELAILVVFRAIWSKGPNYL
jgi:hypothetical protein